MNFQPGEIYFIRELDGAHPSKFVKVGLVRESEGRDSFNRLLEHQTGNPRTLILDKKHVVKTDAVAMVEAQLHRIYATSRVNGEWFKFESEAELASVVDRAKTLSLEATQRVKLFEQAAALESQFSVGETISPTPESTQIANRLALQKNIVSIGNELLSEIKAKLEIAVQAGADVSGLATTRIRNFKPKLDEKKLKEVHPDVYSRYLVDVVKFSATFRLKAKGDVVHEDLVPIFSELSALRAQIAAVTDHAEISKLNEPTLMVRKILGLSEWDAEVLTAQLQIATGTSPGIKGLCTWERANKTKQVFDAASFADENVDLAKSFMIVRAPKTYINPAKKRIG